MLFNSVSFLLFFPAVCVLYYCIPNSQVRARNWFLLIASYYFYMNWEPAYALLLLTSTVVTYFSSVGIESMKSKHKKKLCLVTSLILNIAILFLFKYYNFIAANIKDFILICGLGIDIPKFNLLLPVGISFYTFQALGYTIDVYRGTTKAERFFPTYALFVSFFPQLVAGPIERSNNLLPQFNQRHTFHYEQVMTGLRWMVWGYFLKLVLADRCALYVDAIYDHVDYHNGGSFLLAAFLFTFQIYGDFAGYSLIAIGAAKILGFQLMENFSRPYLACTMGEFWHRWHISLSTWFKDYVYIPLGGNRVGKMRLYFNLLVTFVVSGIWHGANWTFLCWGGAHGMLLCIEKILGIRKEKIVGLRKFCHGIMTFSLVCFLWMIFRSNSISDLTTILNSLGSNWGAPYLQDVGWGVIIASFAAITIVTLKDLSDEFKWKFVETLRGYSIVQYAYIAFLIAVISLFGVFGNNQFIYFQF